MLKVKNVALNKVCGVRSALPDGEIPEIAFAGKSNVGKSSLINALLNRKSLARVSGKPGKTRTINFYTIDECLYLVDLPGYGYASVSEDMQAEWGELIENYLDRSKNLKAVFLLIDIRHDPGSNDKLMYDWVVSKGYQPIIIATKLDKIKRSQKDKHVKMIKNGLNVLPDTVVIPFSASSKQGREELLEVIEKVCGL